MVRIKHTAHPKVLPETTPMASIDETEVPLQRMEGSPDASSSWSLDDSDDCESWSEGSGDTTCESDDSSHAKVAVAAAAVGITFDFVLSNMGKARITSLETCACYFLKGYCWPSGTKMVLEPWANEAMFFEYLFIAGLHMQAHPVLVEILQKI
jgi:hypothetical protein